MADNSIDLTINADDEASEAIEKVADAIDSLDDAELTVDADTRDALDNLDDVDAAVDALPDGEVEVDADVADALSRIEAFERDVDDVTDDARELRITFRAETIQREITGLLKSIEKLDDPTEIAVQTDELERAQQDLRDLSELADRKYEIEVDADPKRTAQRAAGDIDTMRARGEGLQSALPALRGFTDELGDGAAQAGIAGQAMGDLGDFSLILGEKFGLSTAATTAMGTALGAAGLATVIIGTALPAIKALIEGQDELDGATLAAVDALAEQLGVVEQLSDAVDDAQTGDPFLTALLGQFDDDADKLDEVTDAIVALSGTVDEDLSPALKQLETDAGVADALAELPGAADLSADAFAKLTTIVASGGKSVDDVKRSVDATADGYNRTIREFVDGNGVAVEAIGTLRQAATSVDLDAAYADALVEIQKTEEGVARLATAQRNVGDGAPVEDLIGEYDRLTKQTDDAADATDDAADSADGYADTLQKLADQAIAAAEAVIEQSDAALEAAGSNRTVADANLAVIAAQDDWNTALFENTAALGETVTGSAAYNELLSDTTTSAADAADAIVDQADALATSNGETLSASASTSLWNQSMVGAAQEASGPLKQSIIDYIATVNGIPPEKVSEILADTQYETVDEAAAALDGLSETQIAQIKAEADTAAAAGEIAELTSPKTVTIYGDVTLRRNVRYDQGSGTFVPASLAAAPDADVAARALGAPVDPLTSTLAGTTSSRSATVELGVAAGTVNNVTVNLPRAAAARDVARELERWTKRNGR